ncbi:MAG: CRISPR-associated endonuclease Cas1 [Leptolyngbyaceae cyanobacterium RU_5_1]|nr:CRISPR-associated endonuclease Cas1 [Leptolyngbyaceae cyanobacterium RU_5_1]
MLHPPSSVLPPPSHALPPLPFLRLSNFQLAWKEVARNRGCAGVDRETIAHFAAHADRYLEDLRSAIAADRYRPLPLRQLQIPKPQGGWRKLGVPTVRDRIVQQALLNILYTVLEPQFETCSFAYRPGRSHLMAVRRVIQLRDQGYEWVLDADIVQYFDRIQHSRLLAEVRERIDQDWVLNLIESWICSGILTSEGIILPQQGVPQGAVISPILANVYLDDLDEHLIALGYKTVRFADDFIVLTRTQAQILQAKHEVAQLLQTIGLQLHPDKTQITTFDQGFRFLGHAFAGEVVVSITKPDIDPVQRNIQESGLRLVHADPPVQPTAMQKALVEALKTSGEPIPPPLFVVLGYRVRSETTVSIDSDEISWKPDMATLYLVQQGTTLRKEQERFVIEERGRRTEGGGKSPNSSPELPIREVDRILVFGNIQLTTPVISACLELQIPVIFLTQLGEYKGHLWSAESADLVVETAQFQRLQDDAFKLATAREIVQGKLWNSKQLLLRLNRKRQLPEVADAITKLTQDMEAVSQPTNTQTLDQIRGYEGAGAARYFPALGRLIVNPGFSLTSRTFYPPKDPTNSLLSFGYTLLFNNVLSLLLAEGLNPYLGNLHGAERPKAYLAFDLMEEFRSPIVDTLVIKLVNQQILKPTDFTWPNPEGGIYLNDTARRVFLKHFEERICSPTSHPDVQSQVSYRRAIQLQIQRYIKAVLGNIAYQSFRRVI